MEIGKDIRNIFLKYSRWARVRDCPGLKVMINVRQNHFELTYENRTDLLSGNYILKWSVAAGVHCSLRGLKERSIG